MISKWKHGDTRIMKKVGIQYNKELDKVYYELDWYTITWARTVCRLQLILTCGVDYR